MSKLQNVAFMTNWQKLATLRLTTLLMMIVTTQPLTDRTALEVRGCSNYRGNTELMMSIANGNEWPSRPSSAFY